MKKLLTIVAAVSLSVGVVRAEVGLKLSAPSQVVAGDEFTVTLTISKGNITGFARFHQDLPKGFEVEETGSDNEGAVFSFADQRLRLIWANLPENVSELRISYRIRIVEPRLRGNLPMIGRFTYVVNNERLVAEVENAPVVVRAASSVAPSQSIDIEDFQNDDVELAAAVAPAVPVVPAAVATPATQPAPTTATIMPEGSVFVMRQKPYMVDKDFYVNLKVTKGELSGYGKIEEELLTPNSNVEVIETKGALFSTEGNEVIFRWLKLPSENEFVISYKVTPRQTSSPLSVKGVFTFDNGGNEESKDIDERDIDFSEHVPVPPLAAAQAEQARPTQQPKEPPRQTVQRGLVFKVQLLATRQSIGNSDAINAFFAKFRISEPITEEVQDFDPTQYAYKYVIGPYRRYDHAAAVRDQMWAKGITDAFVTCYNNGDRITIQEALMISNRRQ